MSMQQMFMGFGVAAAAGGGGITATGGTKVTSPTIIQHFFTSPGTFTISSGSSNVCLLYTSPSPRD